MVVNQIKINLFQPRHNDLEQNNFITFIRIHPPLTNLQMKKVIFNKKWSAQFAPEIAGHFELDSSTHFKLELNSQYHWNLHEMARSFFDVNSSSSTTYIFSYLKYYL